MLQPKVALTQPYLPNYRVPLFGELHRLLSNEGVDFRAFLGCGADQMAEIAARGDAAESEWAEEVPVKSLPTVPGRNPFILRRLPGEWDNALLVTEMQVANLNAWRAKCLRRPYITLGHGKDYIVSKPAPVKALENNLNRSARHVCTYMADGRDAVIARTGISPAKVSSFNNSTDTWLLRSAVADVTDFSRSEFIRRHGIPKSARVGLYVGAIETYKRVDLLADSFRAVLKHDPSWWLIVAGDGSLRAELEALRKETGRVTLLGHAGPSEIGVPVTMAEVLLNPGRVGLIAVDSLAMRLPLLTTSGARHAPEIGYLDEGTTLFVTEPDADRYAEAWASITVPSFFPEPPTVEEAASNLASSILGVLGEFSVK